uniref:Uncharacterized protein n=1 Tax=viral metagenome TaxID=1070528 RepID=A0A6C0IWM4_9ZZZZ
MRVRDAINRMIDSSKWHFQTNQEELDLGEPYQKLWFQDLSLEGRLVGR